MFVQWLVLMAFAGAWPLGAEALLLCPVATVEGGVTYLRSAAWRSGSKAWRRRSGTSVVAKRRYVR
jgi:hypothetical protein